MILIEKTKILLMIAPLSVIALLSYICGLTEDYKKLLCQLMTLMEKCAEKDLVRVLRCLSLKISAVQFQLIRVIVSLSLGGLLSALFQAFFPLTALFVYLSIYDIAKLFCRKRVADTNRRLPQLMKEIALKSAIMPLEEALREVNLTYPTLISEDFEALADALKKPGCSFKTFARVINEYKEELTDIAYYLSALYNLQENKEACRIELLAYIDAHEA